MVGYGLEDLVVHTDPLARRPLLPVTLAVEQLMPVKFARDTHAGVDLRGVRDDLGNRVLEGADVLVVYGESSDVVPVLRVRLVDVGQQHVDASMGQS